ncbi:hypothetical protein IE81DRAFT_285948 [Ceraceosorus guamensis]|uniref:Uncharacterized protein n=1 Tax=Ceraceosorus guamensis TaxID=1522189 RepID=A0A316W6Q0_9BASI|nr:hypothetical protein IE81DRAFT_285948 [Ceraceosorus guamensis]PWN45284.1 hypothetical protein IE81DRAFT_285948 [Ceraceosorus guamensis]
MYQETDRPQIHYSPSAGFMNDPNGLFVDDDGLFHLYFQYNPNQTVAGNQHWGHATSKDGYAWDNHPIALAPEKAGEGIFSGSIVVDRNNTSGFFGDDVKPGDRVIAIYTLNTEDNQTQDIAYSKDGGYTFTKYERNPVIDLKTTQFRDPKVFWDEQNSHWVMAVAHPQSYEVGFYTSSDLKSWQETSRFSGGLWGYQFECPGLVQIPIVGGPRNGEKMWTLLVSINPGAPLGGSVQQYFFGDFSNGKFTANDTAVRFADFGKDFYAAQTYFNAPQGQAIIQGWASNWQYTQVAPTARGDSGWRSAQSLPRTMTARWTQYNPMYNGYQLSMEPLPFGTLAGAELARPAKSNTTVQLKGDGAFDVRATFAVPADAKNAETARLRVKTRGGDFLDIGALVKPGDPATIYTDRRKAGVTFADTNSFFTDRASVAVMPLRRDPADAKSDQLIDLHVVVDRTLTEVFAQNGTVSASTLTYWDNNEVPSSLQVGLSSKDITLESLSVKPIASTWKHCASY